MDASGNYVERWHKLKRKVSDDEKNSIFRAWSVPMVQEESVEGDIGISEKCLLTLDEAAKYTGIGINKLREISSSDDCDFILWNGSRRMFKKEKLKNYLYGAYSI